MKQQLLVFAAMTVMLTVASSCASKADATRWEEFSFNGKVFHQGSPENSNSIWIRNNFTPRTVAPRNDSSESKLPPSVGAVAGLCFRQTYGGKIANQSSFTPLPNEEITITSDGGVTFTVISDASGLFVKELPQGDYHLFCRGTGVSIRVLEGKTELVHIRGAKRMAD